MKNQESKSKMFFKALAMTITYMFLLLVNSILAVLRAFLVVLVGNVLLAVIVPFKAMRQAVDVTEEQMKTLF